MSDSDLALLEESLRKISDPGLKEQLEQIIREHRNHQQPALKNDTLFPTAIDAICFLLYDVLAHWNLVPSMEKAEMSNAMKKMMNFTIDLKRNGLQSIPMNLRRSSTSITLSLSGSSTTILLSDCPSSTDDSRAHSLTQSLKSFFQRVVPNLPRTPLAAPSPSLSSSPSSFQPPPQLFPSPISSNSPLMNTRPMRNPLDADRIPGYPGPGGNLLGPHSFDDPTFDPTCGGTVPPGARFDPYAPFPLSGKKPPFPIPPTGNKKPDGPPFSEPNPDHAVPPSSFGDPWRYA